ncbi:MAG: WD40 repeat domain-containing protein, partial [bacterium]
AGTSDDGTVVVIDSETHKTTRSRPLCRSIVNRIILMSDPPSVAYGCQEGEAGILDLARDKVSVLSFLEGGVTRVAASDDGRFVFFGGTSGKVAMYDVQTRILMTLLGHTTRITVITPATAAYPYLITGDASGEIRVWPMPASPLRLAAATTSRLLEAAPLPGGPVFAVSYDTTIPWTARDGRAGLLAGHGTLHDQVARSPARARFALYGTDDAIELWSFEPEPAQKTVRSGHDAVSAMAYAADGERFFVGTRDGSVALWSGAGDASRLLGTIHDSVALVRVVPQTERAVIAGSKGALWLASETAPGLEPLGSGLEPLGSETDSITSIACSPDARWLVVGTAVGRVSLYDLASGARHQLFNGDTWIEFVGFSSDSRQILFSTNGRMRIAGIEREPDGEPRLVRGRGALELSAHFAAFSPDNTWLAATGDQGDLWFHRASDDRWVYVATGIAKLSQAVFSLDGTQLVATDPSGRALVVDMRAPAFH